MTVRIDVDGISEEDLAEMEAEIAEMESAEAADSSLGQKEYCATCLKNYKRHTIRARSFGSAMLKATWKCKGGYQMEKGSCKD
jgi:hypothetical protein